MKPNISEFSYGYALTDNLNTGVGQPFSAAPVFPTLYQEGQTGGGFDVQLQLGGVPIFLQFKLSHFLYGRRASELVNMGGPYYRMCIRSNRYSQQHQMLLDLESSGEYVFYAAPYFHEPNELNDAYMAREVHRRTLFIRPSLIGQINDDEEHYIVFNEGSPIKVCSDPKTILEKFDLSDFNDEIYDYLQRSSKRIADDNELDEIINKLIEIILDSKKQLGFWTGLEPHKLRSDRPRIEQLGYLARTFFGSQLFLIRPK